MKKINRPSQGTIRTTSMISRKVGSLKIAPKFIKEHDWAKGKTPGSSLEDYSLNLMKLD